MSHKIVPTICASMTKAKAGVIWLTLMSAAGAFFTVGFVLGVARVVLGLHQEHRKFADPVKLVKAELETIRTAAGWTGSAAVINETYLSGLRTLPLQNGGIH